MKIGRVFFEDKSKFDYLYDEKTHAGFFPMDVSEVAQGYKEKDIKEYFHFYPWAKSPQNISPATQQLYDQLSQLAAQLLQWLEEQTQKES